MPAIQSKAGMALSFSACRAVLADAGALPQTKRSSGDGRDLLNLAMKPSDDVLRCLGHVCKLIYLHTRCKSKVFFSPPSPSQKSALSAKRWFKTKRRELKADLKDLQTARRQTMVQKPPNDGSSHTKSHQNFGRISSAGAHAEIGASVIFQGSLSNGKKNRRGQFFALRGKIGAHAGMPGRDPKRT
jgi:hypothetical protein